jgi:hypothetical protein
VHDTCRIIVLCGHLKGHRSMKTDLGENRMTKTKPNVIPAKVSMNESMGAIQPKQMKDEDFLNPEYWADIWDNHIRDGRVVIPCYHPSVYHYSNERSGTVRDSVTREMFINPSLCLSNPCSIDAAIDWSRDKQKFISRNRRLREDHHHGECPVCLESFAANDQLVYSCHVFHS